MRTRIYILYTGGTIGMAPKDAADPYSPLEPKPLDELLNFIPGFRKEDLGEIARYRSVDGKAVAEANAALPPAERTPFLELPNGNIIEFGSGSFPKPVDSSDIAPVDWERMARMIADVYDQFDGFVILHGTDTMAFTSSALSFILENLAKPVVITGSQLPIAATRTDAVLNFVNAIHVAGYRVTDQPLIPEVVIVFADKIIRGCRASKVSTADWAGFDSPNFPLLGTIGEHIKINTSYIRQPPPANKKFYVKSDLEERVFNINVFPGFSNEAMRKLLLDPEIQGIVMRTYGTGNVPSNQDFLDTIGEAIEGHGKLVVNLSQCGVGTVEMGLYEASSGLLERKVLSGMDMTPEAALTKLMWTLGTQFGTGRIAQMQISQRGEQTENLFDLFFGTVSAEQAVTSHTNATSPDGRLDRDRISQAMLRISSVGVVGAQTGDLVRLRAYMNMPTAKHATPTDEERCVAVIEFSYSDVAEHAVQTRMKNITYKTQSVIGDGDVILTLLADRRGADDWSPVKVFFRGLYVAVYAKS